MVKINLVFTTILRIFTISNLHSYTKNYLHICMFLRIFMFSNLLISV